MKRFFMYLVAVMVLFTACAKDALQDESALKSAQNIAKAVDVKTILSTHGECIADFNDIGYDQQWFNKFGKQLNGSGFHKVDNGVNFEKKGNDTWLHFDEENEAGIVTVAYKNGNYFAFFNFDAQCLAGQSVYFDGKIYSVLKWDYDAEGSFAKIECPYPDTDFTELFDNIVFVQEMGLVNGQACYTEDSWATLWLALQTAAALTTEICVSQEDVDAAAKDLMDAFDALIYKVTADAFFINLNNLTNQVSQSIKETYVYPFFPDMTDDEIESKYGGGAQRTLVVLTLFNDCLYTPFGTVKSWLAEGTQGDSGTTGVNTFADDNVIVTVNHSARSGEQVFSCTYGSFVYKGNPVVTLK